MESLQSTIDNLSKMFHTRMTQFESDLQKQADPPSNTASLAAEFTTFRDLILDFLKGIQQQLESIARSVDHLEMQSRRKILLFHGVAEEKQEDLKQVIVNIVKTKLKIEDFSANDIKRCHRMGKPAAPHRHRPILFKLQQSSMREKIWFTKTKLKGTGITASEFLTKSRHDIFMAARDKFGVQKCWTKEGIVYVLGSDGDRYRINSRDDFLNIDQPGAKDALQAEVPSTRSRSRRTAAAKK